MPAEIYLNVAVSGLLTGLVYGLMALGLSVIFGVVRVVNFAHGEMMTIAMYLAVFLFAAFGLDPLVMMVPIAAVLFALGYAMQAGLINPFIHRPEHSQFMLLVAVAIIMVNVLLIVFGPDARNVQTSYAFDSFLVGPLIVDATKAYAGGAAIVVASVLFAFFRFARVGKAMRACADNYTGALVVGLDVKRLYALTFGLGAACVGAAGSMMVLIIDVTPPLGPAYTLLAFVIVITGGLGLDARRPARRRADRAYRGARRAHVHAVGQEHVRVRDPGAGAAVPAARHPREAAGMMERLLPGLPRHGVLLALALLAALLLAPRFANDYLLTVLIVILYFAYAGQAWNIMMGFAGQLSLGHAIYVGLGAYTGAALYVHFGIAPWIGSLVAIPVAMACGAIIGFLAFRFRVAGVYFAILTIAFAEFARIGFDHFTWVGGSAGFFLPVAQYTSNDLWNLRGNPAMFYYVILALTVLGFILGHVLLRSRMGYYWLAIREDEEAARALGIDTFRYKMLAVVISAGMTSLAGIFFAFYYNNLFPEQVFHISRSIELVLAPIIGGIGTRFGPILGAFLLTGLSESMTALMTAFGLDVPGAKQVFYGICLLVVITVLPDGVWPWLARRLRLEEKRS